MYSEDTCGLLLPENHGPYNRTVKFHTWIVRNMFVGTPVRWPQARRPYLFLEVRLINALVIKMVSMNGLLKIPLLYELFKECIDSWSKIDKLQAKLIKSSWLFESSKHKTSKKFKITVKVSL